MGHASGSKECWEFELRALGIVLGALFVSFMEVVMVALFPNGVETVEDRLWALLNDEKVDFLSSAGAIVTALDLTDGVWSEAGAASRAGRLLSHVCSRLNAMDLACQDGPTRSKIDKLRGRACILVQRFHVLSFV